MTTGKQRAFLRSLAHHLEPKLFIGKQAVTENVIKQTDEYLTAHELLKCSIQQNLEIDIDEIANTLANATNAEIVQVIGRKFVLFRRNKKEPKIELPR